MPPSVINTFWYSNRTQQSQFQVSIHCINKFAINFWEDNIHSLKGQRVLQRFFMNDLIHNSEMLFLSKLAAHRAADCISFASLSSHAGPSAYLWPRCLSSAVLCDIHPEYQHSIALCAPASIEWHMLCNNLCVMFVSVSVSKNISTVFFKAHLNWTRRSLLSKPKMIWV